jgi:hypothetical protein
MRIDTEFPRWDNHSPVEREKERENMKRVTHGKTAKRKIAKGKTAKLSSLLNDRLHLYSLAASATGLSLLALSTPAQAEVIFTPTNVTLTNGQLPIDLNHDGASDFTLNNKLEGTCCRRLEIIPSFRGSSQNGVAGVYLFADALPTGAPIGHEQLFLHGHMAMASASDVGSSFIVGGPFANKTERFVGLQFIIRGETHYGWLRFSIVKAGFNGGSPTISAILTGYAYETIVNKPLTAGETGNDATRIESAPRGSAKLQPASLALLAGGSLGLSTWRGE